ncbi:porin [Echinimonas agarilytica]|uniref:Porin n=1 Tax=Echinimonas agarilytica TaxID=1215918 RepID=A0AA41W8S0_9GAMM|nr:porin [Echinimonas agarilytica]MCM2681387.1 porin [Echinimonas agarilytica]
MQRTLLALTASTFILPTTVSAIELYKDDTSEVSMGGYLQAHAFAKDGDSDMSDGASRINFNFNYDAGNGWTAVGGIEWGLNLISNNDQLGIADGGNSLSSDPYDDSTLTNRLGYIGLKHDVYGEFTVGKQWSAYYDVTHVTDYLMVWGGEGSGTFNYHSDGGFSGTGRAEKSFIYRNSVSDFDFAVQLQAKSGDTIQLCNVDEGESQVNCTERFEQNADAELAYDYGYGVSMVYHAPYEIDLGVAYNRTELDVDGTVNVAGLNDDYTDALAFSANYGKYADAIYLAAVYYKGTNHEIDDSGEIFDSKGTEIYGHYMPNEDWRLYAGYNRLKTDDSNYDGLYDLEYYAVGASYIMSKNVELFTEHRFDSTVYANGDKADDIYSVGIRLYL